MESLVFEHLRHIRGRVDQIADDVMLIKQRLTSLEGQVANIHSDMAVIHLRIDKINARLDRRDQGLELSDTAP